MSSFVAVAKRMQDERRRGTKASSSREQAYRAAQTEIGRSQTRLQAVGTKPPTLVQGLTLPLKAFTLLGRPGAAVRAAIKAVLTPEKESVLGEAWKGFTGKTVVTGEDVLEAAGLKPKHKAARWLAGFGTEVLLDPLTYVTLGAANLTKKAGTKSADALAKQIVKEVSKETGKNISLKSAQRLAANATKGQIPVGRLGTAIQRALGYRVETITAPRALSAIEKTLARSEAEKLLGKPYKNTSSLVRALKKGVERRKTIPVAKDLLDRIMQARGPTGKGAVPKALKHEAEKFLAKSYKNTGSIVNALKRHIDRQLPAQAANVLRHLAGPAPTRQVGVVVGEAPGYALRLGSFMGFTEPVASVDITKLVTGLRQKAKTVGGKPGEKVVDVLGRMFIRDYTPQAFKGYERVTIERAKEAIAKAERTAPSEARVALMDTLKEWHGAKIPEEARKAASYILEEPLMKEYKTVQELSTELDHMLQVVGIADRQKLPKRQLAQLHNQVGSVVKKLEEAQRTLDKRRIEAIGRAFFTADEKKAAKLARKLFNESADRFYQEGIPLNVIQHYAFHLFKDPPEKVRKVLSKYWTSKGISAAHPAFTRARVIPTLEMAKSLGLNPIEDVAITTAVHRALAEQAVVLQKMGRDLRMLGPNVIRPGRTAPVGWTMLRGRTIPILEGFAIHPEVEQSLHRLYGFVTNTDAGSKVADTLFKRATNNLKKLITIYNPRFQATLINRNIFLNAVDGVLDPRLYDETRKILQGAAKTVRIGSKDVPVKVVLDLFHKNGLVKHGYYRQMAGQKRLLDEALQGAASLKLTEGGATLWQRFLGVPRTVGEATDKFMRVTNFLHHLKRGLSPEQAAARTRAALYDYGLLTPFERRLSSGLVPFYSWIRSNLPAMFKLLATRPGIFMASQYAIKGAQRAHDMVSEDIPQWLKDTMAIPIGVDKQGRYIFFNPSLPLSDLSRIHGPQEWHENLKEIANRLNPILTVPVQLALNKDIFSGYPISRYEDLPMQRLKDSLDFAVKQISLAREVSTARRYVSIARDPTAPTPATIRVPGMGSLFVATSPDAVRRTRTFELRDLLRQAIALQEARGVQVPTWQELQKAQTRQGW